MNKKNLIILGLIIGIMLFFIGLATYIALGPSTQEYIYPMQVSAVFKLTGMGCICIAMIVGGFFIEDFEKNDRSFLLIFGIVFLILNIFIISYS
jgi:hypothetical protein